MACLYCGREIPPIRRLQDADFCSPAHRRQYHARLRTGLTRLSETGPQPARAAGPIPSMMPAEMERPLQPVQFGLRHPAPAPRWSGVFALRLGPLFGRSFLISPKVQPRAGVLPPCGGVRAEARPAPARPVAAIDLPMPPLPPPGYRVEQDASTALAWLPGTAPACPARLPHTGAWTASPAAPGLPALALSCVADEPGTPRVAPAAPPRPAPPRTVRPLPSPAPAPPSVAVPEFAPETARPALPVRPASSYPLRAPAVATLAAEPRPARIASRPAALPDSVPQALRPALALRPAESCSLRTPAVAASPAEPRAAAGASPSGPGAAGFPPLASRLPAAMTVSPRMAGTQVFFRWRVQALEFSSREPARIGALPVLGAPPAARFALAVPAAAPAVPGPPVAPAAAGGLPRTASLPAAPIPVAAGMLLPAAGTHPRPLRFGLRLDPHGRLHAAASCDPLPAPPRAAAPERGTPEASVVSPAAVLPGMPPEIGPARRPVPAASAAWLPAAAAPASAGTRFEPHAVSLAPLRPAIPPLPGSSDAPAIAAAARPLRLALSWREASAGSVRRGEFPPLAPGPHLPAFNIEAALDSLCVITAQPEQPAHPAANVLAAMPDRSARARRRHLLAKRAIAIAASLLAAVALWRSGAPVNAGRALASLDWIGDTLASRASVEHSDNFRSGMREWRGSGEGWAESWSYHPDGYIRTGRFALYRPSLAYSDYRLEMLAQIERKSLACAVRARDPGNYWAVKLTVMRAGPSPLVSLIRYPVVGGRKGKEVEVPVRTTLQKDVPYQVSVEVHGRKFAASVEGQPVDSWTDDALPSGGVGMFSEAGERARLYWVKVTSNDDILGRICAMLARKDTGRHAGLGRRFSPVPAVAFLPGNL